jgi:NO-binding membrane sensor protein with MHYT domain
MIGASLVMGAAVSGMHYTGMAAMRVHPGGMPNMSGADSGSFLLPLRRDPRNGLLVARWFP